MDEKVVAVFCGSSAGNKPIYAQQAKLAGAAIAQRGSQILYGGGGGLMEAVASGALEAGGTVRAVVLDRGEEWTWPSDKKPEVQIVSTPHERKGVMSDAADAFLALPGGSGTLEELLEQWTWAQMGLHRKLTGVLNVEGFYDPLLDLIGAMVSRGFTRPRNADLLLVDADLQRLIDRLLTAS